MATLLPLQSPPQSYLCGLLVGAFLYVAFLRVSLVLTEVLGTKSFKQRIASLDRGKLHNYHSLLPSTVHAVVQVIGTYNFVFGVGRGQDTFLPYGSSPATWFEDRTFVPYGATRIGPAVYMGVFVGYLLADVTFDEMGTAFLVHHFAAAACWTFCACNRVMQPVGCLLQFNEVSTPLMNLRQYLLTAGYASSDAPVVACGLAFFVVFAMARVGQLPYVLHGWVSRDFGAITDKLGLGSAVLLSVFFATNALLQCSWFLVMCTKLLGLVFKEKPKVKRE